MMVVTPVHSSIQVTDEITRAEGYTMQPSDSPKEGSDVPMKILDPTDVYIDETRGSETTIQLKYKCGVDCPCRYQMKFSRRVRNLPPVTALAALYETVKRWNPLFNCMLSSAEVAVLVASVPARLVSTQLSGPLSTPTHVADQVMCRGLDLAERALPCLKQPPTKSLASLSLCACGVPAASCYMCSKLSCKAARTCLCDVPAVACAAPALACMSAAEICVCDVPRAFCCLPAAVVSTALRRGCQDIEDVFKDVNNASRLYNNL